MQRFFVSPQSIQESIQGGKIHVIEENLVHQILRVMRMEKGSICIFLDDTGIEYVAKLIEHDKKTVMFEITEKRESTTESKIKISLFQALPKKLETLEMIFQKCTELGVVKFVPIVSDFCNRRELSKVDRLERIITEAAEQSERRIKPILESTTSYKEALMQQKEHAVLFHSRDTELTLKSFLCSQDNSTNNPKNDVRENTCEYAIFIGPEGGFSPTEIEFCQTLKIPILTLGPRILRTETAAIVTCGMFLQNAL